MPSAKSLQVEAVVARGCAISQKLKLGKCYPPVLIGDFFEAGDLDALPFLEGLNVG